MKTKSKPKLSAADFWDKNIDKFDIPEIRKEYNETNARWFLRNAWIRNKDNPLLDKMTQIAKKII